MAPEPWPNQAESRNAESMPTVDYDDDFEIVPIPLDRETLAQLARLGKFLGEHPIKLASMLLRDIVKDDAMAHAEVPPSDRSGLN